MYERELLRCRVCGEEMDIEYFVEEEYDREGHKTGRVRTQANGLICWCCGHKELVDDDTFSGPWRCL